MQVILSKISRVLLALCMIVLLTLGNAYAGVCDEFGLDASDSYYIPAPITKFCVLAGSDPPKKWVPEKGFGKGLTSLHSGLQVMTGKASSLCPSPKMGDGAKGCPNFQFPNCATIPSDDPAQQTAQAKSGACVKGAATIQETANASENDVDETYDEITQDDIKCVVQLDLSTTYMSDTADQSVCFGGNTKFCSTKGDKDTCDTQYDSELPNAAFPHAYAVEGWAQMNDIKRINVGSAWLPDLRGDGYKAFESLTPEQQDMMMDSMFQMTGDFKTTEETLLELNNDFRITWKKVKKTLGIRTGVDYLDVKCTNSTIIIPKDTLFTIRNLAGADVLQKYIIFWNNTPILYKRNLQTNAREGDVALNTRFIGLMPPAGDIDLTQWMSRDNGDGGKNPNPIPKLPYLSLEGKALAKSGNLGVFKEAIRPYEYDDLYSKTIPAKNCNIFAPKVKQRYTFPTSDITRTAGSKQGGDIFFRNCPFTGGGECGGDYCQDAVIIKAPGIYNLNAPMQYRNCGMRKCSWGIIDIAEGEFGCDGSPWTPVNVNHVMQTAQ